MDGGGTPYSLVDLDRAGVPLLEIVSEPDMHSAETRGLWRSLAPAPALSGRQQRRYGKGRHSIRGQRIRAPQGASGDKPCAAGTRTEVKNLNSFRAMERAILYEIERQSCILEQGGMIEQETLGRSEARGQTYSQRSKERGRTITATSRSLTCLRWLWKASGSQVFPQPTRASRRKVPPFHAALRPQQLQRLAVSPRIRHWPCTLSVPQPPRHRRLWPTSFSETCLPS